MSILLLMAFGLVSGANWMAAVRGKFEREYLLKPASLAALMLFALVGGAPQLVLAALLMSLLGDVYLMLPGNSFFAGLASFLVAHILYVVAFPVTMAAALPWFG